MSAPLPPSVANELAQRLDANLREDYEERAGIIEFDANQPRELAECLALLGVLQRHPAALIGVTALEVEMAGAARVVLTTDAEFARERLATLGMPVVRVADLASAIRDHCSDMALLARFG